MGPNNSGAILRGWIRDPELLKVSDGGTLHQCEAQGKSSKAEN